MTFEQYLAVFAWCLFAASSVGLCYSEKQPRLTWVVPDFRSQDTECLNAVGYAWMLERNLTIHFKNITPTEILFCPQNLHCSGSHSWPFLVTLLLAPSVVVELSFGRPTGGVLALSTLVFPYSRPRTCN